MYVSCYVYQILIDFCKMHVNVLFQPSRMNLLYQKAYYVRQFLQLFFIAILYFNYYYYDYRIYSVCVFV